MYTFSPSVTATDENVVLKGARRVKLKERNVGENHRVHLYILVVEDAITFRFK
jgi:hypothetical protein